MLPNGSIRLYFTDGDEKNPCGLVSNCIGVAQSDSGWKGIIIELELSFLHHRCSPLLLERNYKFVCPKPLESVLAACHYII